MLQPSLPILAAARRDGYGVGAFNLVGFESIGAIIRAAEAERSPALMMIWSGFGDDGAIAALAAAARVLAERATVPLALHLDHEADPARYERLLRTGFTSAMIDGGAVSLDDNIARTREAIRVAHPVGASVEAVIGEIGNEGGGGDVHPTDVDEAVSFYEQAQPDILAVSIGTQHGRYDTPPALDLDRLGEIGDRVSAPLVLHGGSYCPPDQLRGAIERGIAKVNIATELDEAFLAGVRGVSLDGARYVGDVVGAAFESVQERVQEKMELLGSSGRTA